MPRHKEFDPEEVLDEAVDVFWESGYDATSVQDLVDRMGINRFSLYDTFGDKHELFLLALDRYRQVVVSDRLAALETSREGLKSIHRYFSDIIDYLFTDKGWKGCLMTNSAVEVAPRDREAAARVSAHLQKMSEGFHHALVRASNKGELKDKKRLRQSAWFLTCTAQGLGVVAKTCRDRTVLEGIVKAALDSLR